MENSNTNKHYRTLFISDIHLGTKSCQAEAFLDFFKEHSADKIYLVGDIVDFWKIKRHGAHWPQAQNDVVQKLLRSVRKGTEMVYIPGNHDEALRDYCGTHFGGVEVMLQDIHVAADGKKYLIMHGDEFDIVTKYAKWLAYLGDWAYEVALTFNRYFNFFRRKTGQSYWSLSAFLKKKVKGAVNFIGDFEESLAKEAKSREVDGVICGHIHTAAMRDIDGVHYINTGDWVESCTAVGETFDGTFEMINWVSDEKAHHTKAQEVQKLKVVA